MSGKDADVIPCEWPHHDGTHKSCNQCRGAGTLRVGMEFRFVLRGQDAAWRRRLDMGPADVDCTDLTEDAFIAALLAAGCSVYTEEHRAAIAKAEATP